MIAWWMSDVPSVGEEFAETRRRRKAMLEMKQRGAALRLAEHQSRVVPRHCGERTLLRKDGGRFCPVCGRVL